MTESTTEPWRCPGCSQLVPEEERAGHPNHMPRSVFDPESGAVRIVLVETPAGES